MKRIFLAVFALSLMITVSSCRESAEEKTEEVMEETSMEEAPVEAPVQEEIIEVEEVAIDTTAAPSAE